MHVDPIDADRQVRKAKSLFQQTLAQWASDVLILQSHGERVPTWRHNRAAAVEKVVVETMRRKAA